MGYSSDNHLAKQMVKVVFVSVVCGATAWRDAEGMGRKGFRHVPSNKEIPTATITDDMRAAAPAKLDWTGKATTPIKDQGDCGSCWAYSVTEGVESGLFMTSGKLVELSPQQIIDCDQGGGDYGCDGGDVDTGTEYVDKTGGLALVKDYPETSADSGYDGTCKKSVKKVVKVTDYEWAIPDCTSNSCSGQKESDLMAALNSFGPLSICLSASWGSYSGGVLNKTCSHALMMRIIARSSLGTIPLAASPIGKFATRGPVIGARRVTSDCPWVSIPVALPIGPCCTSQR